MSLQQEHTSGAAFLFSSHVHSPIRATPWDAPSVITRYPGLVGISERTDRVKGRLLVCDYTIHGVEDEGALETLLRNMARQINQLTGTLVVTPPTGVSTAHPRCTFKGYVERTRFQDGAGTGWVSTGQLRWLQRSPNYPSQESEE